MNEKIQNELAKWRFPGNNHTQEYGLDTPDMEIFAKDHISSLAREICQNSIDARLPNQKSIVEFKTFTIAKNKIPGIERIEKEIKSCANYQKDNKKIHSQLIKMEEYLSKDEIFCLRISDFNTTGLKGVNTEKSPFFLLTKGSGISDKVGTTGGSKGIGKFASFVASSINTVFYSTINIDGERGSIGISKLCSTTIENSDQKTIGIGYYAKTDKNNPILDNISIDPYYERKSPGTDIFIIGFRTKDEWKLEVITKILDSFLSAIYYEQLEVVVDDVTINKDTLPQIIIEDKYIIKKFEKEIKSQYILLTDEKVHRKKVDILDYGTVSLFVKSFSKEESYLATKKCVMIRYPYMKIKTISTESLVLHSAMCIINDDKLNEILRDIENPQHTNWEINRVNDNKSLKTEIQNIIKELNDKIKEFIYESIVSVDNIETDVEGASDYLPNMDDIDGLGNQSEKNIVEKPILSNKVSSKAIDSVGIRETEDIESISVEIGMNTEEGSDSLTPTGFNDGNDNKYYIGDEPKGFNENGDSESINKTLLGGIQYRFFVTNIDEGNFSIVFNSPYDESDCELELYYLDGDNNRYKVEIISGKINNNELKTKVGKIVNLKIESNKKYIINLKTNLIDLYACEVKLYANR